MSEALQIRIHGGGPRPTLVFLPGTHGDWTVIGGFRRALADRVRFVEFTYPRTVTWSLDDYAAAVEAALAENHIDTAWLLGESFSSQVVWAIAARNRFPLEGIILAGGFVRHPLRPIVYLAEFILRRMPLGLLRLMMAGYAKLARFRFRRSAETLAGIQEFIARRTEPDRQAAAHRLWLIARNDPRAIAGEVRRPVYGITGVLDPIVPWIFVRPWLRRHCPALREYKVVWSADHNVLSTAPQTAAELVVRWMATAA